MLPSPRESMNPSRHAGRRAPFTDFLAVKIAPDVETGKTGTEAGS